MRDRAGVARWAHNPKVVGSNPSPATSSLGSFAGAFLFMEYAVYILYSKKSNRTYVGMTSHLIQRFYSHAIYGKDSTSKYRPWMVFHVEFFATKSEALQRERYFKQGSGSRLKHALLADYLARWAHTLP